MKIHNILFDFTKEMNDKKSIAHNLLTYINVNI